MASPGSAARLGLLALQAQAQAENGSWVSVPVISNTR